MRGLHPITAALALQACALGRVGGGPQTSTSLPASAAESALPGGPSAAAPADSATRRPQLPEAESAAEDHSADDGVDDDADDSSSDESGRVLPHPLDGWSNGRIAQAFDTDRASVGSISVGAPNAGALFNAVPMPTGDGWTLADPRNAWGTSETIENLVRCIGQVQTRFPNTAKVAVGDISAKTGGPLRPHRSHQAGRDVDIGYYYLDGAGWYTRATDTNLDRTRTWALVRALTTETDVELILIDRSIQGLLRAHAYAIGEDRNWVDSLFDGAARKRAIIRHAKGHATHIHVRFYSPIAQETGRRVYSLMIERHLLSPQTTYTMYVVKKGESLGQIAKKFGTTSKAIRQANGLHSDLIRAGVEYRIARHGVVRPAVGAVVVPPRRLPPATAIPVLAPAISPSLPSFRSNAPGIDISPTQASGGLPPRS